ncbi:MAG: cupin domain-containing protein [Thermodesulfobacteriota bacterium]
MQKQSRREFLKKAALGGAALSVMRVTPSVAQSKPTIKIDMPKTPAPMEYVRRVDFAAIAKSSANERFTQNLFDHTSGAKTCTINCIKTPAGGGSPAGMHIHAVDQIFYILSGTMSIEIESKQYDCSPGSLIIFPAGVRHRNWNGSSEPTVHLAFQTPLPDPNVPFAKSV